MEKTKNTIDVRIFSDFQGVIILQQYLTYSYSVNQKKKLINFHLGLSGGTSKIHRDGRDRIGLFNKSVHRFVFGHVLAQRH